VGLANDFSGLGVSKSAVDVDMDEGLLSYDDEPILPPATAGSSRKGKGRKIQ
jgi:hypothetical protein